MWRTTLKSLAAHKRRLLATGSAVLLGVAFLSGTLVLVHTVTVGFSDAIADAYAGTDALVRSDVEVGREELTEGAPVDRSLGDTLAAVDGVAAVAPRIESTGRIVGADGDPIGADGRTTTGNWIDDDRLNPYDLAEGRAPAAPGEVVIDVAAAEEGDLAIGDTTVVRTPDQVDVTIVGLVTFGGVDSPGSSTYAGFTTEFAGEVLLPDPGKVSDFVVAGEPGADQSALVRRLDAVLPGGVETLTGAELIRETEQELTTPASAPALDAAAVVATLAVGTVVALLASLVPAVRASRILPLAALRDVAVDRSATSRRRAVAGVTLAGVGIVLTVAGAAGEALTTTGLGALAALIGVVVLGPVAVRPVAAVLGAPHAVRSGMSGVLARHNATRNPRRTAGAAAPLMIGVAVVSLFTVVAASLKASIADAVDEQLTSDPVIIGEGSGGVSTDLAPAIAELPEVAAASPSGVALVWIDGANMLPSTFDPATIEAVEDLDMREGALRDVRTDQVAISAEYAEDHGLAMGDPVTVQYPDGVTEQPTVGAIFEADNLSEGGGIRLPRDAYLPHTSRPADGNMQITLADGVSLASGERAVQRVADRFGAPDVQTNDEIDVILTIVYALLVLAIVIALMGIANTLSLSIHERTRELGLLRAVGQTRGQTRAMVHGEAITVALFGTAGGVGLGLFLARGLVSALAGEGFTTFTIPTGSLAVTFALGALAGMLAALGPARRAAHLDVLSALAAE